MTFLYSMSTSSNSKPGNPATVLEGVTYAVVLAILLLVLSPYAVTLFNVLGVAGVLYSVAKQIEVQR